MCNDISEINELIKEGRVYVPREYRFYDDTGEKKTQFPNDKCAKFPKIYYSKRLDKWVMEFTSADFGGYDVQIFYYLFDDLNDLLMELFASADVT